MSLGALGGRVGVLRKGDGVELALGIWSLVFIWSLDLGVWCFVQVAGPDAPSVLFGTAISLTGHEAGRRLAM